MAIKFNIDGVGEVEVNGAAEESTMQEILAAVNKMAKINKTTQTTKEDDDKKASDAKKKEIQGMKDSMNVFKKLKDSYKKASLETENSTAVMKAFGNRMTDVGIEVGKAFADIGATAAKLATDILTNYDTMAGDPIGAASKFTQTFIDVSAQIMHIGVDFTTAIGQAIAGFFPGIGTALSLAVGTLGQFANTIIDMAQQVLTIVNGVLEKEFKKRVDMLNQLAATGASFAQGMTQMADYANQSGIGIVAFTKAVVDSRGEITAMGLSMGEATYAMSQGYKSLATVGKSGVTARDSLLALGYSYQDQGKIMAQYMAQQKAAGRSINDVISNQATLAAGTLEYGKNLKVISDITGQNAQQLMDQARADSMRGALQNQLTAQQSAAFQQAYATLAAVPGQQAPKLQAALEQLLAGGTVTDPIIAGNQQVMTMLNKTAQQVAAGNTNMIVATQANLADAAQAFRDSGQSATDFATLMNPGGTSSVAQGMSALGNALNQYQYSATAAQASADAATGQASVSDGLTATYVGLTSTMTSFQNQMESIAGQTLPAYSQALIFSTQKTMDFMTAEMTAFSQFMSSQITFASTMKFIGTLLTGGTKPAGGGGFIADTATAAAETAAGYIAPGAETSVTNAAAPGGFAKGGIATPPTSSATPKFDEGGIATGSTSGYAATLHGTEAVVPLPDNRSIPVNMDSSSLTAAVNQQTNLLNQILSSMNKNNSLTSGILQASM